MQEPSRPFERYRTRSALFLMIYAVTALIFGIPNVIMLTKFDDGFMLLLATSILVVSRFVGYIKLAGFALLEPASIKKHSSSMTATLSILCIVLVANAGFLLYRFGLDSISVAAVSFGSIASCGVIVSHLLQSRKTGLTRSILMRMVTGVLIVLGCADICINTRALVSPAIGVMTLFFGFYTERKSLMLALRQTLAAATGSLGGGITLYFLRYYLDPGSAKFDNVNPPVAIAFGTAIAVLGMGYYFYSRRQYLTEVK